MSQLTLPELVEIMRECAGEDESAGAGGRDIGDADLEDLGYDSLALMEAAARVKRQFKAELSEEALAEIHTLNQFVAAVNDTLDPAAAPTTT
jgi:act minimal PKS acyl carrier protein